jgi:hypothetical protein
MARWGGGGSKGGRKRGFVAAGRVAAGKRKEEGLQAGDSASGFRVRV